MNSFDSGNQHFPGSPPQNRGVKALAIFLTAVLLFSTGCVPNFGLSPREGCGNDFSTLIYEGLSLAGSGEAQPLKTVPLRIGVIQAGEVGPSPSMLAALLEHPNLIAEAEPLPGIYDGSNNMGLPFAITGPATRPVITLSNDQPKQSAHRRAVDRMRALAADMGLDYMLLFGGTIDSGQTDTPLAIFNLTIVGLYLCPSREFYSDAHAAAALIDVHSGRVAFMVNAQPRASCLVPYVCDSGAQDAVTGASRNQAGVALAKQFIARLSSGRGQ